MRLYALLIAAVISPAASALPCLSWTEALRRESGEVMTASETVGYRLYMERITKNGYDTDVRDVGKVNRYCYKYTLKGTYWFQIDRVDANGLRSKKSEKQKTEMK